MTALTKNLSFPRYVRKIWHRRYFIAATARANLKVQHARSYLGRLWLLLSPLALAVTYFLLVMVLAQRGQPEADYFMYLTSGIFAFYFLSNAISSGSNSVTSASGLILQQPIPALVFPLAALFTAWKRFAPALIVLLIGSVALSTLNVADLAPIGISLLLLIVLAYGISTLAAVSQVFLRDTASAIPLLLRVLLYTSPVLYNASDLPENFQVVSFLNPFFWPIAAWCSAWGQGEAVAPFNWLVATGYALIIALVSTALFLSSEKRFATHV